MRRGRLSRGQWFAVVFTAAGMLALLVNLVRVGPAEAVVISTVLMLFVAIAALLVSFLSLAVSLQPHEVEEHKKDAVAKPASGERPIRQITLAPLGVASALLCIALCIFASDALLKYSASWPWWVGIAAAFLGFAAASSGVKADATRAAILVVNTLWFFSYSVLIVEYRQTSSAGSLGQLATLSWIGAVANVLFLAVAGARGFRDGRGTSSALSWQPFFLSCLAVGMVLTAVALRGSSDVSWDMAGWSFTAAVLADLILLFRAPQPPMPEHR